MKFIQTSGKGQILNVECVEVFRIEWLDGCYWVAAFFPSSRDGVMLTPVDDAEQGKRFIELLSRAIADDSKTMLYADALAGDAADWAKRDRARREPKDGSEVLVIPSEGKPYRYVHPDGPRIYKDDETTTTAPEPVGA